MSSGPSHLTVICDRGRTIMEDFQNGGATPKSRVMPGKKTAPINVHHKFGRGQLLFEMPLIKHDGGGATAAAACQNISSQFIDPANNSESNLLLMYIRK